MAKWQPPIPAGALYSAPARKLGAGLALLAWCYDAIQRDGTATIQITEAAQELEESYHTVKKWWHALRAGPFFASVDDRGKRGYVVKFADDWVDWRVVARPTATPSSTKNGTSPELEGGEGAVKVPSSSGEVPTTVHDTPAYKVLNTTDQAGITAGASAPPSRPTRKARAAKPDATPEPIRKAIAAACAAESGRMLARVNKAAKAIWSRQQENGKTAEQTVAAVPLVAAFLRRTVYPFTEGQPLTPEAFDDRWAQAAEDERARRRQITDLAAPPPPAPDAPRRMSREESAARLRELAAAKNGGAV